MIRIAFRYDDRRLLARLIAWWQRDDASHCELILGQIGSLYDCASSSWLDGGVRRKRMELPPEKWRVYELDRDPMAATAWFDAHEHCGYDWLGVIGLAIRPVPHERHRYICTEACAAAIGIEEPWRLSVADLENLCALIGRRIQ